MAYAYHERLSALDASFLSMEDGRAHMHIGSVAIFEAAPLTREGGGLDIERILEFIDAQLHKVPRFRQVISWVPGFAHPVWVDDASFNLLYHVRHSALPPPGDERLLKRLAGRVLSQEFDRSKPLWEYWFVDGLEGDRFALISKMHHCMADGISGVHLGSVLMGRDPAYRPAPAKKWLPRPAPGGTQLFLEELRHRVQAPFSLLRGGGAEAQTAWKSAAPSREALRSLTEGISSRFGGAALTPLNVSIGPHRRFDWTRLPLDEVHDVGARAGATVNDVALAVASGALRAFLERRGVSVDEIDFRAFVPVSVRAESERNTDGNRVSGLLARLPVDEPDPWQRLLRVVDTTHELKSSGQASAGDFLGRVADLLPTPLLGPLFRRAAGTSVANIVITNVPGPREPVYLLGARMLASYPVVPLLAGQALGIALFSHDGGLYWGFNSDWDAVPDLHELVLDVERGFEALRAESGPPLREPEASSAQRA
jgi:diacylglycerol O-acyltransferase